MWTDYRLPKNILSLHPPINKKKLMTFNCFWPLLKSIFILLKVYFIDFNHKDCIFAHFIFYQKIVILTISSYNL